MKKFTKVCLIIAAVCLFLGAGMTVAAASMGGRLQDLPAFTYHSDWEDTWHHPDEAWHGAEETWDDTWHDAEDEWDEAWHDAEDEWNEAWHDVEDEWDEMDSYLAKPLTEVESQDFTGVRNLDIEVSAGAIEVLTVETAVPEEQEHITVKAGEGTGAYRMYMDGDKLCVDMRRAGDYLVPKGEFRKLQVLVPSGFHFDEAEIEIRAGAADVDEITAGSLDLKTDAGALTVHKGNVGELDCELNAGELCYGGTVSRDMSAECNAGSFKLKLTGAKTDYNYEIDTAAGSVTVGSESYAGVKNKEIRNTGAVMNMELQCRAGAMEVTFEK